MDQKHIDKMKYENKWGKVIEKVMIKEWEEYGGREREREREDNEQEWVEHGVRQSYT